MTLPRGPKPSERPHYLACVEELARRHGPDLRPGKAYEVRVRHDEWCDQLAGSGPCNCNPVATLVQHGE